MTASATARARIRLRDLWPGSTAPAGSLPPGQRLIHVLPRYGTHFARPIPNMSRLKAITIRGADHLHGESLSGDHGGPARLLSPSQYGYKSVKHLCSIELHRSEPAEGHTDLVLNLGLRLVKPHPRARVAAEERHRYLPPWAVRWLNFNLIHPVIGYLSALRNATDARSAGHRD